MKLDKYTDIVIAVVLLCLLYANLLFTPISQKSFRKISITSSRSLHNDAQHMPRLFSRFAFILVLHTTREGLNIKRKKEEEKMKTQKEGDAVEKKTLLI